MSQLRLETISLQDHNGRVKRDRKHLVVILSLFFSLNRRKRGRSDSTAGEASRNA